MVVLLPWPFRTKLDVRGALCAACAGRWDENAVPEPSGYSSWSPDGSAAEPLTLEGFEEAVDRFRGRFT